IKSGVVLDRHVGDVRAVDGVSLTIRRGETLGLVGESGCGKSTVGRTILRLYKPTAGRIVFDGRDITNLSEGELRPLRRRMQMINLFEQLQDDFALTYLFIAHDLAVVRHISDRIAVMYLGSVMEVSPAGELYDNPLHPYTISLLSAVPIPDPVVERQRESILLAGDVPSPAHP